MSLQIFNVFGIANATSTQTHIILTCVQEDGTSITRAATTETKIPGIPDGETRLLLISTTIGIPDQEPTCLVHVNGEFDTRGLHKTIVKLLKQISHTIS